MVRAAATRASARMPPPAVRQRTASPTAMQKLPAGSMQSQRAQAALWTSAVLSMDSSGFGGCGPPQKARPDKSARCEVDEFPMGNLVESGNNNPQVCRLVHWKGNGEQGNDCNAWKSAQWSRCSSFRRTICRSSDGGPPATWKFGPLAGNRGIGAAKHFVSAYGFDSQTANSVCFAFLKRGMYGDGQEILTAAANLTSTADHSGTGTCHVEPTSREDDDNYASNDSGLRFEDMDGNPIDGRDCGIIYGENEAEVKLLVDEDDNVVDYVYVYESENHESPVTVAEGGAVATGQPAMPASDLKSPTVTVTLTEAETTTAAGGGSGSGRGASGLPPPESCRDGTAKGETGDGIWGELSFLIRSQLGT
ncbi:hypothetical protein B0T17DRAFT_616152 [Bombardia bombarda]|uniref:Uncharacterized protein n=1 Tax=Bombardia bombarda TaxID=252184 RepID=A0AA39XAT7_9PEZI|nr:hypothetical protein B0T17DRAFT_616152 [Bombardia bombarda]